MDRNYYEYHRDICKKEIISSIDYFFENSDVTYLEDSDEKLEVLQKQFDRDLSYMLDNFKKNIEQFRP